MRWGFVVQVAWFRRQGTAHLFAQCAQFQLELIDLVLLAVNGMVQRLQEFFGKTQLGFDVREAGFHIGS
jgi:hypothetical protein